MRDDFCAVILTHGRPDKVRTLTALERSGYTGDVLLLVDDQDPTLDQYLELHGDRVHVFSKAEVAGSFDMMDNRVETNTVTFARKAVWQVMKDRGYQWFIQLDDDYIHFSYRIDDELKYLSGAVRIEQLDRIWEAMIEMMSVDERIATIAMAQGGDYIGGASSQHLKAVVLTRKAMNSFICNVDRPFDFLGRLNDDVNAYIRHQRSGQRLFFTFSPVYLDQGETQANEGGLTDMYKQFGTYVKSFYSVMASPSSVQVQMMGRTHRRLHHRIYYNETWPKLIRESHRKKSAEQ